LFDAFLHANRHPLRSKTLSLIFVLTRFLHANRYPPGSSPRACFARKTLQWLFRPNAGIAAGAAGRRDHRRVAGIGRRCADFRIDAGGWTQHTVGFCQGIAERLASLAGGRALRHDDAARRNRLHRRAMFGCGCRRRLGQRRHRCGRELCALATSAGAIRIHESKIARFIIRGKRTARARVPHEPTIVFSSCGNGSARNAPSAASACAPPG